MADFLNDPLGTKYGCSYRYSSGTLGTFSALLNEPTIPRRVKDPVKLDGADFEAVDVPFAPVVKIGSYIQMLTTYTYPTNKYALGSGTEEVTKEEVDFSKFKKVISFSSLGEFAITAIPKDQLLVSKNLIATFDYPNGIEHINITANNATVYVALTKDNVNWVKYDTENEEWVPVDLTATTDVLKTTMMPLATLTSLTSTEYNKYFNSMDYVGIAMVMSIEPTSVDSNTGEETYDTTKSYTITPIEINYVGDDDASGDPLTQYFNFIKVGYTPKGDPLLVADRVIQTGIAYSALNNANYDFYNGRTKAPMSTPTQPMYMRLLNGGSSEEDDEYYKLIINAPSSVLNGKTVDQTFNVNLGSMTNIVATSEDDEGTAPGTTTILYRGGESLANRKKNIAYNASNSSYGWRPVLEIDCTSKEANQTYPGPALPEVHTFAELTKGKCISCDFYSKWSSNQYASGSLMNFGKARLGLLSDYKNTKSGSFYFICVGYTNKGEKILVADRNIATGFNGIGNLMNAFISSTAAYSYIENPTKLDGVFINNYQLTLVPSSNDPTETVFDVGMWNNIITNEYDRTKTIDQIWHTDKIASVTSSISSITENYMILRGGEDMAKQLTRQKSIAFSGAYYEEIGYRPMIIVSNEYRYSDLHINFKTGYELNENQDKFEITCNVYDPNDVKIQYKLTESSTGKALTSYSDSSIRTIPISEFTDSPNNPEVDIVVKKNNVDYTIDTISLVVEDNYRLSSNRTFAKNFGGFESTGANTEQYYIDTESNSIKSTNRTQKGNYVEVSSITDRIKF